MHANLIFTDTIFHNVCENIHLLLLFFSLCIHLIIQSLYSTSFQWFPKFQPSTLNHVIIHHVTSVVLCYHGAPHSHLAIFNEHFNLLFNLCPILPLGFHIMLIPLLKINLFIQFLLTLPSLSPLQPICSSDYSPLKSNSPYLDSQLPWFEIIQLTYLLTLLLQLPPPQTLVYLLCGRISRSFYK